MSFGRQGRGPWIGGLAVLLACLASDAAVAQVIMDLATVRPKIYAEIASHQLAGGGYGQYGMDYGSTAPSYYASIDVALSRTIMGENLLTSITGTQRNEWISHLHTFALPDGGYTDTYGHNVLHANGQTIGALGALGGQQKYPASPLYAPFDTPAEATNYLEMQIDWTNQWSESHKFWGGLAMYSQSSVCTTQWKDTVFNWLDTNVNPATGWWRIGEPPSSDTQGLGGGAHIWPMFEHCGHAFPEPERVIDRILSLQGSAGNFAGGTLGNYINLDALYGLRYMKSLAPTYKTAEIEAAAVKHAQWVNANLDPYLAGNPNLHALMATVGDLGLLNQLLPTRCPDTVAWTDIFTAPKFYQTAAVEVFAPQTPPVGAEGPAPYAYSVLGDAPVGYWRLGETAAGGVAEAQGKTSLQGLHIGLGSGTGPGNVAQPGPRPSDGFTSMRTDNRAIHLAGEYDYVAVYETPELDITGALTLEAWVRLDEIPAGNEGIVSKYVGSGNQRSFGLYVEGQGAANGTLTMAVSPDGTSSNASVVRDDAVLPLDTWLLVAGTYMPGQYMRLYINGSLAASLTSGVVSSIYDSASNLWIGCIYDVASTSSHFAGLIDEVAVYDRVLSPTELLEHYKAAFAVYGDANMDGFVNQQDADVLAAHWGMSAAEWTWGDFNGDHVVNAADAAILTANWGHGSSETLGVPEPSILTLLVLGGVCVATRRRPLSPFAPRK